jgi:uncharacterized RDD family membrane protein YckC
MSAVDIQAGRVRRLLAFLIDFVLTACVAFIVMWPLGTFEEHHAYEMNQVLIRVFLLVAGSYMLVHGWWLHTRGQTVGKRALGIRLVANADGVSMPGWKLLVRTLVVLVALAIPFVGLLVIVDLLFIFTSQRRCLHDYLVGSAVVKNR